MVKFKLKPKHWYQWLNPYWWRKAKIAEEAMNYMFREKEGEINQKIKRHLIYGDYYINNKK